MQQKRSGGLVAVLGIAAMLAASCAVSVTRESGFLLETNEVVTGLNGPTQIAFAPDGRLLVAELNGAEDAATGRVVVVDHRGGSSDAAASREVLFTGLDKPTGLAVFAGDIWVMEKNRLSRGSLQGRELEVVADELVNNGRSEGTLTVTPDDRLLYDTSGRKSGATVTEGSGRLWEVTLTASGPEITELGSGFKHAYAHAVDSAGNIWVAEMTDGQFDGAAAPDEIVKLAPGEDHGWPWCVGNNVPVAEYGGTASRCSSVPGSQAVLGNGATPTSVALAPWDDNLLLVALWSQGQIVAVPLNEPGPVEPQLVLGGLRNPQHLLADGDSVLISEFGAGRIMRLQLSK